MCGIMGYIGHRDALPILLDGLRRLEYRGYDSAGVAVFGNGRIEVRKAAGKLSRLAEAAGTAGLGGTVGIGHTRWATHGVPTDANAHPHADCTGRVVVIHNGIIENFFTLKEQLAARGHIFRSDTDTEVLAHLIEEELGAVGEPGTGSGERGAGSGERLSLRPLEDAVRRAIGQARGAYAVVVMSADQPDRIVAVRQVSPLIVGLGEGEMLLASDIPPLLAHTRDVLVIEDGEMAVLTAAGATLQRLDGTAVRKAPIRVTWNAEMAEKGGYPHFMIKEIHEQPQALQDTMMGRLDTEGQVELDGVHYTTEEARALTQVWITACGTAFHAGLVGRWYLEHWARIPVEPELASELRYRDPLLAPRALAVAISQSGETADTLAAVRETRARGARVLAVTNVVGSTLAREADDVLYTRAGPEIAVASSKAYLTMLVGLQMLALDLALRRGVITPRAAAMIIQEMKMLPGKAAAVLRGEDELRALAERLAAHEHVFFIGRGLDYAAAMEGSLKLKEISYVHSEALAAGELKHGTLALISRGTPVFALITQRHVHAKTLSNIAEVKARGGEVIAVAFEDDAEIERHADAVVRLPRTDDALAPVLAVIPLQLFAYHVARVRGNDIDQPRNLAKSVTVE